MFFYLYPKFYSEWINRLFLNSFKFKNVCKCYVETVNIVKNNIKIVQEFS